MKTASVICKVIVLGAALAFASVSVQAGEPKNLELSVSDSQNGVSKPVFGPATPMLYLKVQLKDLPKAAKVKAAWIAEKTKAAPPNYQIDSAEFTVGELGSRGFTISKPNAGWPVGDYRVDLSIDGKVVSNAKFKVQ